MKALPPLTPGVYPGSSQAGLLRANEQQFLFQQQLVTSGQASIAVQLERIRDRSYPNGLSLQIWFTDINGVAADPGAIDIELQTSDLDVGAQFCDLVGITALNTSFAGRIETSILWAKYARVRAKTITNAVYLNALVTR